MRTLTAILAVTALILIGCAEDDPVDYPPMAPTGVYSVTGDGEVTIAWNPNTEPDLDMYAVYSSAEEFGRYDLEGTTYDTFYTVPLHNGNTRYFAVAAVDFIGNESELSYETVWDTPRPEGWNLQVHALFYDSLNTNYERCAIDFSDYDHIMVQSLDNSSNDVYIDNYEGAVYLNAFADDTDIALIGRTDYLSDVDFVDPEQTEWAEEGYLPLQEDHAYVIWTYDNHFAALRVEEVYYDRVILEWAYQTVAGNPQLKTARGPNAEPTDRKAVMRLPKTRENKQTNAIKNR